MLIDNFSHRRYNPLTGEWVLVSPHRAKRPWQGKNEETKSQPQVSYDPTCYLCPGNLRAQNTRNPSYEDVYVFDNDFPSLQENMESSQMDEDGLFVARGERGICRVICFSPNHDLTLAQLPVHSIVKVINAWKIEYEQLGAIEYINYVQIFENKGEIMGCSNPHPHGQIWATESIPDEVVKESRMQTDFYAKHQKTLLSQYLEKELIKQERIIIDSTHFVVVTPFWAIWPFETMIISKRPLRHIGEMHVEEVEDFAKCIKRLTGVYDALFQTSFPYSAGIHQSPTDGNEHPEWHFHMHFYPPLLRSATVKKFMVGFEMLGNPQRDMTPEESARLLKNLLL